MFIRHLDGLPGMAGVTDGADHVDVRSMDGAISLRAFTAGMLSYRPGWMSALWRVRGWLVRLLGLGSQAVPDRQRFTPASLPVTPGEYAGFFRVLASDGETHWLSEGKDSHLTAILAVTTEPGENGTRRFHLVTSVRYQNRTGRLYFNLIRPFHHLVVWSAMRAALRSGPQDSE